jgi:hypothetical protein
MKSKVRVIVIQMTLNRHAEQHPARQRLEKNDKDEKKVINGYEMTPMVVKATS